MHESYRVYSIGRIRILDRDARIEIDPAYHDGLLGLDGFSHILVYFWFHENDTPAGRRQLRIHPRKNPANPLTGVFATHAPMRPNLIGTTVCRVKAIHGGTITIDTIDAHDGSPVIDIKCYIPETIDPTAIRLPDWVSCKPPSSTGPA